MPIRPRYKLFSNRESERGRIEIEDLRGVGEDGYVAFSAYLEDGDDDDGGVYLALSTDDLTELREILNDIIGRQA